MRFITLQDIQPYTIANDELNSLLFIDYRMNPEVRNYLLDSALRLVNCFTEYHLDIHDVILRGSNAGFYYNSESDVDVHIVGNYSKLTADIVNQHLAIFHDRYGPFKLTLNNVDFYMEHVSAKYPMFLPNSMATDGVYSILYQTWLKFPHKSCVNINPDKLESKFNTMIEIVDWAMMAHDLKTVKHDITKFKNHRRQGLHDVGELSVENLIFKVLRKRGVIARLYEHHDKLRLINTT